jgi:hypothetical protein
MAKFDMQLPKDIIKDLEYINNNSDEIFGQMTKAGAETVYANVKTNIPKSFAGSNIMNCLKITKIYKTPSDGGINTKVGFYGYFINENGVETPAPLVANVFEYGSSKFVKKPFFRRSFKKAQIEKAMLEAQKQYSKGILSNE